MGGVREKGTSRLPHAGARLIVVATFRRCFIHLAGVAAFLYRLKITRRAGRAGAKITQRSAETWFSSRALLASRVPRDGVWNLTSSLGSGFYFAGFHIELQAASITEVCDSLIAFRDEA